MTPPLNPTAASLLGFLHHGEMSGYELVQLAELVIGDFWSLTRSQVYRELATLADRGLIKEGTTGPRARRPYRLTRAGRTAFKKWIATPPAPEQIRFPLLLAVAFGEHLGDERLLEFVAAHREAHEARLASYRELSAALGPDDRYQRVNLAFGIHYEEAVLAWMKQVPEVLGR